MAKAFRPTAHHVFCENRSYIELQSMRCAFIWRKCNSRCNLQGMGIDHTAIFPDVKIFSKTVRTTGAQKSFNSNRRNRLKIYLSGNDPREKLKKAFLEGDSWLHAVPYEFTDKIDKSWLPIFSRCRTKIFNASYISFKISHTSNQRQMQQSMPKFDQRDKFKIKYF